jgi:peptide/nickel transport system substrate-binding protein
MQGFWNGWAPAFPSANEFLSPLFECDASFNVSGSCDPALDERMDEARALQATDPAGANQAWTEIEHQLVDEAVRVPIANPVTNVSVSARVGNVQVNPQLGILLSQLWVR